MVWKENTHDDAMHLEGWVGEVGSLGCNNIKGVEGGGGTEDRLKGG